MDMTEPRKFENEVRPLRLSEAIRIGAKLRPQAFCVLFFDGGSCALGAAYEGLGNAAYAKPWHKAYRLLEELFGPAICAEVARLNDSSGWTREQIADWLEAQGL